ncbi:MAG: hypothetical protein U1D96_08240 [Eubacteriales bacterium]|nr:hypothetical protein [Bacillota bacterium]MBV1728485.1 hypothetical protein [Desulforudis sp.]MDP3051601.1 hypothetical protein [Eubacteriales bacterium]MBV1735478.1 hypothetical protein [Desulforudis sp.]MDP3043856.1 hypothetical protein [Bacillota bacterium]
MTRRRILRRGCSVDTVSTSFPRNSTFVAEIMQRHLIPRGFCRLLAQ